MRRRAWLAVPALGVLAYLASPVAGQERHAIDFYNVAAAMAVLTYWLTFALRRPPPVTTWVLVGVGVSGLVLGDLVYTAVGGDPIVSIADGLYVVGYLGFIVAAARLLRARTTDRDLDRFLDGVLVGIAAFLLIWISVIGPSWDDSGVSNAGRLMSALYPVLDVVLLFFLARVMLAPGRVDAALVVFALAIAAILVADTAWATLQQSQAYDERSWNASDTLWLVGYALLPVAAMLRRRDAPETPPPSRRASRLAGLLAAGIALVTLPIAAVASRSADYPVTTAVLVVAGGAIVVLVFVRFIRLHASLDAVFDEVERQRHYYRAVAEHASDSYFVITPDGVVLDAAGSLRSLVGSASRPAIGLNGIDAVHPDDRALAVALLRDAVAHPGRTVPGEVRAVMPDGHERWIEVFCTNLCDDPAVGGVVVNAHDITERKHAEEELEHRALHDAVTGAANRALLRDRIERALARRAHDGIDVAVLFCDLDGFKLVNDTVGHDAGDEVLRIAAARLAASLRPIDTLARIGGDEFAILLESEGELATEASAIAERLLHAMSQPVEVRGVPMIVTTSIGIAVASLGLDPTPDSLLRDADTAMYTAKAAGRNQAVRYDPSMGDAVHARVQLGSDVRLAVDRDELELRYQPIVELATGTVTGFEALVRWNHPTRGLLVPDDFIGIAEDAGTIVEIGDWVVRTACRDARRWGPTRTGATPILSVNVSKDQLAQPDFVERVARATGDSGFPSSSLVVEITESALVEHPDQTAARLRTLSAAGVRVAIDDFGVGRASLADLRQFPVDIIKLDRSFVDTIVSADHVPALVGGLLELARTLDLQALAEGIETTAQRAALRDEGCALGQGFLFSEPVDARTAGSMLGYVDGAAGRKGLMSPASHPPSTTNSPPVQ